MPISVLRTTSDYRRAQIAQVLTSIPAALAASRSHGSHEPSPAAPSGDGTPKPIPAAKPAAKPLPARSGHASGPVVVLGKAWLRHLVSDEDGSAGLAAEEEEAASSQAGLELLPELESAGMAAEEEETASSQALELLPELASQLESLELLHELEHRLQQHPKPLLDVLLETEIPLCVERV